MSDERLKSKDARLDDANNPEWTSDDFAQAQPASQVHGKSAAAALERGRGRPPKPAEERKRQVTLRLTPEVLEAARASGRGWQVRAEDALRREFVAEGAKAAAKGKPKSGRSKLSRLFTSKHRRKGGEAKKQA